MAEKNEKKIINQPQMHTHVGIIVLCAIAIALSVISFVRTMGINKTYAEQEVVAEDISYNVYIGLTDKNQNRQLIANDVAIEIIKTICVQNNVAYTIYEVQGGFKDAGGCLHTENTIKLEMDRINDDTLHQVLNDVKRRINTSSMMVLKNPVELFDY